MATLAKQYLNTVIGLLNRLQEEEMGSIEQAAKMIADAIENGHTLFAFGCTHSSLP
ncbi:MAG: DUF2529 family protein, partial [Syntrophothermus sp.]